MITTRLVWRRLDEPTMETCTITASAAGGEAVGLVTGMIGVEPLALRYRVVWDGVWRTRQVLVEHLDRETAPLVLVADGQGGWLDSGRAPVPMLEGCLDVDIACTPLTNTLAIRRLALPPGESARITAAYVPFPSLAPEPVRQRYVHVGAGLWRYEGIFRAFVGDIAIDKAGFVLRYDRMFERLEG